MTLLDAYALIAHLAQEPQAGPRVSELLRGEDCAITSVNLAETIDRLARVYGVEVKSARAQVGVLVSGDVLRVLPFTDRHGALAGELRARHYHPRTRPLSVADCALLAVAADGHRIATADPAVLAVAAAERLDTIALAEKGTD